MSPRRALLALVPLGALMAGGPGAAVAQEARVSPFLPDGHWAAAVARTLDGQGLMPAAYDAARRRQPVGLLLRAFEGAAPASTLASDAAARLREELGPGWGAAPMVEAPAEGAREVPAVTTAMIVGLDARTGTLLAGRGQYNDADWIGPETLPDRRVPHGALRHAGRFRPLAWGLDAEIGVDGADIRDLYALAGIGNVALWLGAMTDGYVGAPTGSVVVTGTIPGPGGGLFLAEPVRLPGFLRHLGGVGFSTHLYRAGANGRFRHPWVLLMRGTVAPHGRLTLGVNRGIMMGGEGNAELSFRSLAYAMIGKHSGAFDNQITAVTVRYRLPTERMLPLVAALEWGFEDSAGAWRDVPGIQAVVESPALPFAPEVSAGVALTRFRESCCGNPIWYRNWSFEGGWTDAGRPLGHPLGGHGRELLGYGRAVLAGARVQVEAAAFDRWRGSENLYYPLHVGHSRGGLLELTLLPLDGWQAVVTAELDHAVSGSWQQGRARAGIVVRF